MGDAAWRHLLAGGALLAGCSGDAAPPPAAPVARTAIATTAPAASGVPRGATIEASGFATILGAPSPDAIGDAPSPPPPPPPPPPDGRPTPLPMTPEAIASRASMMNPDEAARRAAMALDRRLKVAERAHYVGVRVVRDPRPRYAFQFRWDAAATLARHTRDPRFTAREGGLPTRELQPIFDRWWKAFEPMRLVGGGGVYQYDGIVRFDMNIDEAGFRAIAARERWALPDRLVLNFSPPRGARGMDPALARFVRVFAREDRVPAIVNAALLGGRIVLRDGCFRLADGSEPGEPLVIFGRDAELGLDPQGYMILGRTGSAGPRIGERFSWGGPRGASEDDPGMKALRAACGAGPVVAVGIPSAINGRGRR